MHVFISFMPGLMQLVRQSVIENTFGLCFGFPRGGVMLLGEGQNTIDDP